MSDERPGPTCHAPLHRLCTHLLRLEASSRLLGTMPIRELTTLTRQRAMPRSCRRKDNGHQPAASLGQGRAGAADLLGSPPGAGRPGLQVPPGTSAPQPGAARHAAYHCIDLPAVAPSPQPAEDWRLPETPSSPAAGLHHDRLYLNAHVVPGPRLPAASLPADHPVHRTRRPTP